MSKRAQRRLIVATVVLVAVFAVAMVYVVASQGAYYRQVSALSTADNGRNVKVGGAVVHGTIVRDASGVHLRMEDLTGRPTTVGSPTRGRCRPPSPPACRSWSPAGTPPAAA